MADLTGKPTLLARRLGIDSQHEAIAFVQKDCAACKSEGFSAHSRVLLQNGSSEIFATLHYVTGDLIRPEDIGLSEIAWQRLNLSESTLLTVSHPAPLTSFADVRGKIFGQRLTESTSHQIIQDIVEGRYSDIQLSAFVTACSARVLDGDETIALTRAMVDTGRNLDWGAEIIADKHCVGGLPGNRTTPIIVSIAAANGLIMPKTSSKAITSPAGTADTMSTITNVALSVDEMKAVLAAQKACFIWGGSVDFSPADDKLIRVQKALDLDSEGPLIASVLSKKVAAGATHLVLDIPVGPTAKVRSIEAADSLRKHFEKTAAHFGIRLRVQVTDGHQPVGRGIGPALEARDVLAVLRNQPGAPPELKDRACLLAGALLELTGVAEPQSGTQKARETLESGAAYKIFEAICLAQGGYREPPVAAHLRAVTAPHKGRVAQFDNRRLAKAAKLAGAPEDAEAGIDLHVYLGDIVEQGDPLFTLHTQSPGEMAYALDYVASNPGIVELTAP
ncbi:MAG: thymidine phosphorylase family protein [Hyphomonadaceae bacterium]|nr:thymidine phosphorylase family protein [Hyphomonadaceae bacterium]